MPDGNVAIPRFAERTVLLSVWRRRYLAAVREYVVTRKPPERDAALSIARVLRRIARTGTIRPCGGEARASEAFRKRLYRMALHHHSEWGTFFVSDVGIRDAATREAFMEVSPFKGCILLLHRIDGMPGMTGDVDRFRQTMRRGPRHELAVVHQQAFLPEGRRKGSYVLIVLRHKSLGYR